MAIQVDGQVLADIKQGHVVLIGRTTPCETPQDVLLSGVFRRVLWRFLRKLERYDSPLLDSVQGFKVSDGLNEHIRDRYDLQGIVQLFYTIHEEGIEAAKNASATNALALGDRHRLGSFIEEFYNFWRRQERFLIYHERGNLPETTQARNLRFVEINQELKSLVLNVYRHLSAQVTGKEQNVYRQLPAGSTAGLLVEKINWDIPSEIYQQFKEIPFLQLAVIDPPLVYYPKRNKRKGQFVKVTENPLKPEMVSNNGEWVCFPAKVGDLLIFIYFHIDYLSLAVSMVNLFEVATKDEIKDKRPDGLVAFGVDAQELGEEQTVYYQDRETGLTIGAVGHSDDVDYFGYFKKMALTLHNTIMIDRGYMPIHGAMAHIQLRSGQNFNVVLVGDSGAGKSESLEAFRVLADEYIRRLTIIFDDMGSLRMKDGKVHGYGTEIGAFVRLDDLEPGFAYEEIDRSIFMNPHRTNARLVVPITDYKEISRGYPVDLFLYANNYEAVEEGGEYLELFESSKQAFEVFRRGARIAKGTTDEKGLVETYFSNPFGAPQKEEQHDHIAMDFLEQMFQTGVKVGQLRTQLGVTGVEMSGPEKAAKALFDYVNGK